MRDPDIKRYLWAFFFSKICTFSQWRIINMQKCENITFPTFPIFPDQGCWGTSDSDSDSDLSRISTPIPIPTSYKFKFHFRFRIFFFFFNSIPQQLCSGLVGTSKKFWQLYIWLKTFHPKSRIISELLARCNYHSLFWEIVWRREGGW